MSLTRDGHLSELALERVLAGEVLADATEHAAGCEVCALRLDAARAASPDFAPPAATSPATPTWPYLLGATLAAAAALTLYAMQSGGPAAGVAHGPSPTVAPVAPESPPEQWRVRGSFHLQVFVHDGDDARRAKEGEQVRPGDRLVFQAELPRDGHLLIAGIDAEGEAYLCFPQGGGGRSAPVARGSAGKEEAVRLDDVLGTEEIVAVFCDAPFDFVSTIARLKADPKAPPEGCLQRNFTLQKVSR